MPCLDHEQNKITHTILPYECCLETEIWNSEIRLEGILFSSLNSKGAQIMTVLILKSHPESLLFSDASHFFSYSRQQKDVYCNGKHYIKAKSQNRPCKWRTSAVDNMNLHKSPEMGPGQVWAGGWLREAQVCIYWPSRGRVSQSKLQMDEVRLVRLFDFVSALHVQKQAYFLFCSKECPIPKFKVSSWILPS